MKKHQDTARGGKGPEPSVSFTVRKPETLLPFLLEKFPDTGRNSVKSLLRDRCVYVDGRSITQYNHPLVPGTRVEIRREHTYRTQKKETSQRLRIIHEDEAVIVIDKSAGLLSIADEKGTSETAYSILYDHVRSGNPAGRVFIVHRLDRDTSGLMLFAKNIEVKQKLQNDWKNIVSERLYTAVVEGVVEKDEGIITSFLAENSAYFMYSTQDPTKGREAVTSYRTLKRGKKYSLLQLKLQTGRKNQIRIHLKEEKHPVAGDKKYGAGSNPIHRLALHASRLSFTHPLSGKAMSFNSPAPASFLRLCAGTEGKARRQDARQSRSGHNESSGRNDPENRRRTRQRGRKTPGKRYDRRKS